MVRRSPVIAAFLIVLLMLMSAVPVFAYGQSNNYHLRLSRLDRITCDKKIGIKAHLTTNRGEEVRGATVYFEISKGGPGDTVDPRSAVTDRHGDAYTRVKLDCRKDKHEIVASVPGKATARITLITGHDGGHDGDHGDHDGPPRGICAGVVIW